MIVQRPAQLTDAGRTGAILSEFVDTTAWMPRVHTRAQDIAHTEEMIRRGWVRVAIKDDEVVGFLACHGSDLNAFYIATAWRGQGIGAVMIRQLKRETAALRLWTFQANIGAQKFYEHHGFAEVRRTDGASNDERMPDIRFEWTRGNA